MRRHSRTRGGGSVAALRFNVQGPDLLFGVRRPASLALVL